MEKGALFRRYLDSGNKISLTPNLKKQLNFLHPVYTNKIIFKFPVIIDIIFNINPNQINNEFSQYIILGNIPD